MKFQQLVLKCLQICLKLQNLTILLQFWVKFGKCDQYKTICALKLRPHMKSFNLLVDVKILRAPVQRIKR